MSNSEAQEDVVPVPAATILLVRDGADGIEVFMVKRHHEIEFAAGALVFPGGKASRDDFDPGLGELMDGAAGWPTHMRALAVAAIREAFEEAGVLLARDADSREAVDEQRLIALDIYRRQIEVGEITFQDALRRERLRLAGDELVPFAHWITPRHMPRRFDTHFFLARAPLGQEGQHCGRESVDSLWIRPQEAVANRKTLKLMFPTRLNLMKLAQTRTVDEALATARAMAPVTVEPWVESGPDGRFLRIRGDAGYKLRSERLARERNNSNKPEGDMGTAESDRPSSEASRQTWVESARAAAGAGDWPTALARWEACIGQFGAKPQWLARKAAALTELNRFEEAEPVFLALAKEHPDDPAGILGLSNLALRRRDWPGALSLLMRLRKSHPDAGTPALAAVLARLGRSEESQELWSHLLEKDPGNGKFQAGRLRAAAETCRQGAATPAQRAELATEIEHQANSGDEDFRVQAIGLLSLVGERGRAAKQLLDSIGQVSSLNHLRICFRAIPLHIERGSRGPLWERLLTRVRAGEEVASPSSWPAALELELRLLLALERLPEFCARFDALRGRLPETSERRLLERVRERLDKPRREVFAEPKVFGIGLTKTGTTSLHEALVLLGIDSAHWTNPLTHQLLSDIDIYMFGAATDTCISSRFELLYHQYPNASFVWTQRDPESWLESFQSHHGRTDWADDFDALRARYEQPDSPFGFASAAIQFNLYLNAASLRDAYFAYESRVRRFFADKPREKLLELDLPGGQGWPELCRFLNRPVPDRAFPWTNRGPATANRDCPETD